MSSCFNKVCENCATFTFCRENGVDKPCEGWNMSVEYFMEICSKAPWYIVDKYNSLECS